MVFSECPSQTLAPSLKSIGNSGSKARSVWKHMARRLRLTWVLYLVLADVANAQAIPPPRRLQRSRRAADPPGWTYEQRGPGANSRGVQPSAYPRRLESLQTSAAPAGARERILGERLCGICPGEVNEDSPYVLPWGRDEPAQEWNCGFQSGIYDEGRVADCWYRV